MFSKIPFAILFVGVQLFLVFFHIHKSSQLMQSLYRKQKDEKEIAHLMEEKNTLTRTLEMLKKKSSIKEEALLKGMVPVRLNNFKRVDDLHDDTLQLKT